jgi:DNA polymerase III epsilon subunit-like protein
MISSQPNNDSPNSKPWHGKQGGDAEPSPAIIRVTCFEEAVTVDSPNPVSVPKQIARQAIVRTQRLVVIDLQTTGVSPDEDDIIQIVASRLNPDGFIDAEFSTYVRPRNRVSRHVTRLTGIHDADVAEAPTTPEALRTLARFVEGAVGDGVGDPMIVTLKGNMPFFAAACASYALPLRIVRFIDSLWFFEDFWRTFYAKYPVVPDLNDLVDLTGTGISTDIADPTDTFIAIQKWFGVDAAGLPHPRHDGAVIRVRLFVSMVWCAVQSPYSVAGSKQLKANAREHVFIAST